MLAVVGTTPDEDLPVVYGEVCLKDDHIYIQGKSVEVTRGTPALLAAACKTCEVLNQEPPFGFLAGDIGLGKGSRELYQYLTNHLMQFDFKTITFHYLQPDVDWHDRVLFTIKEMAEQPILIADAGFMYAAKMSGQALEYELFTPDAGELAFLADEKSPHPFYTRGFILHDDNQIPELIERSYEHNNAAKCLLVKGQPDYVANDQKIVTTINQPVVETMEAMGGTGDTVTGIVSALIGAGIEVEKAASIACRVNRLAGYSANPTPASQVTDIIEQIPSTLSSILNS
ncbi:MAG: NAD(P)H-hydrate dehydratase [Thermodesulfobacteriota bacterium]|nr:NAD(P)H-hydrate dehydratase [Thermodesulfobacteriota bacterium]